MLTGAVLARVGLNRKAAYAMWAMVIAAEFPDIDTAWGAFGPVTGFAHHRGITHTFLALPFEAAVVTGAFWAWNRWRKKAPSVPVSWGGVYAGCLLALLSHLLLDWTNNYGLRPFFPFNDHWYAGSFVFIFEPVMFLMLLVALVAPVLFGLINTEVGAHKDRFQGPGWAVMALAGMVAFYGLRFTEHEKAIQVATDSAPDGTTSVFASPHPINPLVWSTVTDAPTFYQLGTVDAWRGIMQPHAPSDTLYKPEVSLGILAAKRTYLGRIYLDWSMYPVITEAKVLDDPNHPLTAVTFRDARFMYDVMGRDMRNNSPITGTVTLDMAAPEGQRVVEMKMGDREQKGTD